MVTVAVSPQDLRLRAVGFAALARMIGPDVAVWSDTSMLEELREVLIELGESALVDRVDSLVQKGPFDTETLEGQWVRWFDQGRIAPYECSNKLQGLAGPTAMLADVAGFYKAFGVQVKHERPDHIVAELEFMALVNLAEADALERDAQEEREVSSDAARSFLRDHLGGWVDAWAARLSSTEPDGTWAQLAALIDQYVAAEAQRRNVIPVRSSAAFADNDLIFDEEPPLPECGSDTEEL